MLPMTVNIAQRKKTKYILIKRSNTHLVACYYRLNNPASMAMAQFIAKIKIKQSLCYFFTSFYQLFDC